MSLLLYINGQLLDLEPGQVIAQTKQVNDLNSLDDRQAGYTNKFNVPKTAHNLKVLDFMTITGNTSGVPYQKNECSLYADSGECFIYKGWAVITDGGNDFDVVVYDGIIDLYKDIENTTLASLGLDELTHDKTTANVLASWNTPKKYKYILADYNGKAEYRLPGSMPASKRINVDYLVPSVSVSYLWNKIFAEYGYGYSGAVFNTENFKNLWMTYPKGALTTESSVTLFESDNYGYTTTTSGPQNVYFARYNDTDTFTGVTAYNQTHIEVQVAGYYEVEVTGTLHSTSSAFAFSSPYAIPKRSRVYIGKNAEGQHAHNVVERKKISDYIVPNTEFTGRVIIELQASDSICVVISNAGGASTEYGYYLHGDSTMSVKLSKLNITNMSFGTALADFSTRDFLTEIVHRFGLTMFKRKYEAHYEFLTLQELLQGGETVDWTGKFVKKHNEDYIYGNYAQRNWFRYAYNNKEDSFNDGFIDVENKNLADAKNMIQSKIYSPENEKVLFLNRQSNLYKLWEKEIVEDPAEGEPPVKYKALDKRYYFLRAENVAFPSAKLIGSAQLGETGSFTVAPVESYRKLPFDDIIEDYYTNISKLLDRSLIITADMYLSASDVANFDFRKLYYIEQLSGYFIVNKIINYIPGKPSKCELVRVQYSTAVQTAPLPAAPANGVITITGISQSAQGSQDIVTLTFSANYTMGTTVVQYRRSNITTFTTVPGAVTSPATVTLNLPPGGYHIRILDITNNISSNAEQAAL